MFLMIWLYLFCFYFSCAENVSLQLVNSLFKIYIIIKRLLYVDTFLYNSIHLLYMSYITKLHYYHKFCMLLNESHLHVYWRVKGNKICIVSARIRKEFTLSKVNIFIGKKNP